MKYKLVTTLFATAVISISIYAVLRPSYDLGLFIQLGKTYAQIRIMIALIILAYVLISSLRIKLSQILILSGGASLLVLGITSLFSPMLLGHLPQYVALGDTLIAMEAGTISLLAGLQLETKKLDIPKPDFTASYFMSKLLPVSKRSKLASS